MMTQKQRQMVFGMALIAAVGVLTAQISIPNTFTANTRVVSADVNTNFSTLGAAALNRTGGTMTGTLTAANVMPDGHNTRDLGATATRFRDGWFGRNVGMGGTFTVESAAPDIYFDENDVAADNQVWRMVAGASVWYLQAWNDALTVSASPIAVTRSGTTISSVALSGTTVSTSAALAVGTTLGVGGGTPVASIITGTVVVDFPNVVTGAATSVDVTVTGAVPGSVCFGGLGVNVGGAIFVSATVSAANLVSLAFLNHTAGPLNLASTTARVTCFNY